MSDGMTAVERVIARDEIRQLTGRYALAIDARDLDLLVSLFVPDVRVGRSATGRAALRDYFANSLSAIGVSILFVGQQIVDFESRERARGVVYCRGQIQDGDKWIEQAIQYRDLYRCVDGAWLIERRDHLLWYGVETAERPLDQPPANWPANHVGRGTLPEHWPSWGAFWQERERGKG